MEILIRKFEASEIDFLQEMFYESIFVTVGEKGLPKSIIHKPDLKKYTYDWGGKNDIGFVAEKDGKRIGIIWSRLFNAENQGYGYIDDETPEVGIAVKAEYQNRGIGSELFKTFFIEAIDRAYKKISLSVDKRNRAVRLYKREGFKIVVENNVDFVMLKFL